MATIAYDSSTSTATSITAGGTLSWNHTVVSGRGVAMVVNLFSTNATTFSNVTIGGQQATFVGTILAGTHFRYVAYNVPTGVITVSAQSSVATSVGGTSHAYLGVGSVGTPVGGSGGPSGSAGPIAATPATNDWSHFSIAKITTGAPTITGTGSHVVTNGTTSLGFAAGDFSTSGTYTGSGAASFWSWGTSELVPATPFTDDFGDGYTDNWTAANSTDPAQVVGANGTVYCAHSDTSQYNYLQSIPSFDLTNAAIYVQIRDFGDQTLASHEVYLHAWADNNNSVLLTAGGGFLYANQEVAGVTSQIGSSIPLDTSQHEWLRIRESGGTTFFDTSPDALTWTNQFSTANPFSLSQMYAQIGTGNWQTEASGSYAIFDNFNLPEDLNTFRPARIPNPRVGPMAQRRLWRPAVRVFNRLFGFTMPENGTTATANLLAGGTVEPKPYIPPIRIANPFVGPMAMRKKWRPQRPKAQSYDLLTGDGDSPDIGTNVTANLLAGGFANADLVPPVRIPNPRVGPMALRRKMRKHNTRFTTPSPDWSETGTNTYADLVADGTVEVDSGSLTGDDTGTDVVVSIDADGTSASVDDGSTAVASLTADGVLGVASDASTAATASETASGVLGTFGTASTTANTATDSSGVVDMVDGAATSVTVSDTAAGALGLSGDATTSASINVTAVGALGFVGAATTTASIDIVVAGGIGSAAATSALIGIAAAGVLGISDAASADITVDLVADAFVTDASGATVVAIVGLTAAGAAVAVASMDIATDFTAAGTPTGVGIGAIGVALNASGAVTTIAAQLATAVTGDTPTASGSVSDSHSVTENISGSPTAIGSLSDSPAATETLSDSPTLVISLEDLP